MLKNVAFDSAATALALKENDPYNLLWNEIITCFL